MYRTKSVFLDSIFHWTDLDWKTVVAWVGVLSSGVFLHLNCQFSVLQGDILFLKTNKDPTRTGEIVVFNVGVSRTRFLKLVSGS
jgi:hypothetical protein